MGLIRNTRNRPLVVIGLSVLIFLFFVALVNWAGNRQAGPVTRFDFSRSASGFRPVGEPAGTIRPGDDTQGRPALAYAYENQADHFTGVGTLDAPLKNFTDIRVAVYSQQERTLGVVIDEEESGAVYVYTFVAPAGEWLEQHCPPDLFMLSPGSSDTNNMLDTDQLNTRLIIADMSGFEGITGENTLWIESITITRDTKKGEQP